jgi:hypothetical protein
VSVSLVAAARDRRLLGAQIDWRPKQLEVLELFGGPVGTVVLSAGRQGGKSSTAMATAIHNAAMRPDLDAVLPRGRTRFVLVACPAEHQARENIAVGAAMIDASDVLRELAKVSADRIDFELANGAKAAIRALPANSRSVRGMSASLVIADELAHFNSEAMGPANDRRMLEALEPSMSAFGDLAKLIAISTPYGQSGEFWRLFQAAQDGLLPNSVALQMAAWVLNPALDSDGWRESRIAAMGLDSFLQEHGAEFTIGGGAFFDLRGVEFEDGPVPPEDGRRWVAGFDPAFHGDRFGLAVVGESVAERGVLAVGVLDGLEPGAKRRSLGARRAREDSTLERVWELVEPYAEMGLRIVTDQHQADAVRSYFGRLGPSVQVVNLTAPVQTAAFTSTRTRLVDGSLRLWRHPLLIEELRRVRAREGAEAIVLPRFGGGHCDVASALALATWAHRGVTDAPPWRPQRSMGPAPLTAGLLDDGEVGSRSPRRRGSDPDATSQRGTRRTPPPGWPGFGSSIKDRKF